MEGKVQHKRPERQSSGIRKDCKGVQGQGRKTFPIKCGKLRFRSTAKDERISPMNTVEKM